MSSGGAAQKKAQAELEAKKAAKKAKAEMDAEMAKLLCNVIVQPKLPPGTDPKSVLCEFFKAGKCNKGAKCRYSHDLNVGRKVVKAALYEEDEKDEGMDDWDQETLEAAVKKKHGAEATSASNATKIICKYFLEAIEKRQYGWFWKCPNGTTCMYKHALPKGYILKSQMKALLEEEEANRPDATEVIESERAKVTSTTKITDAVFKEWHAKKWDLKRKRWDEDKAKRRKQGKLTGKEIYEQEGYVAEDDAGATDDGQEEADLLAEKKRQQEAEEEEMKQLAAKAYAEAQEAGGEGLEEELAGLEDELEDLDALEAEINAAET